MLFLSIIYKFNFYFSPYFYAFLSYFRMIAKILHKNRINISSLLSQSGLSLCNRTGVFSTHQKGAVGKYRFQPLISKKNSMNSFFQTPDIPYRLMSWCWGQKVFWPLWYRIAPHFVLPQSSCHLISLRKYSALEKEGRGVPKWSAVFDFAGI